jgi:hypothetical protein
MTTLFKTIEQEIIDGIAHAVLPDGRAVRAQEYPLSPLERAGPRANGHGQRGEWSLARPQGIRRIA